MCPVGCWSHWQLAVLEPVTWSHIVGVIILESLALCCLLVKVPPPDDLKASTPDPQVEDYYCSVTGNLQAVVSGDSR